MTHVPGGNRVELVLERCAIPMLKAWFAQRLVHPMSDEFDGNHQIGRIGFVRTIPDGSVRGMNASSHVSVCDVPIQNRSLSADMRRSESDEWQITTTLEIKKTAGVPFPDSPSVSKAPPRSCFVLGNVLPVTCTRRTILSDDISDTSHTSSMMDSALPDQICLTQLGALSRRPILACRASGSRGAIQHAQ